VKVTYKAISWGDPDAVKTKSFVTLMIDNWNDFGFKTYFQMNVYDEKAVKHEIGGIKIGFVGQSETTATYSLFKEPFSHLPEGYFSLGQSPEFYKALSELNVKLRDSILRDLNDVVFNPDILVVAQQESVFNTSLLRGVSLSSVKGQYKRILEGADLLTKYQFEYTLPKGKSHSDLVLDFAIKPESNPPTNVHVLIGRNGAGKTYLLNNMIETLVDNSSSSGEISNTDKYSDLGDELFSGVLSVSFSAFDPFEPYPEKKDKSEGLRYSYVGLKRSTNRGGKKGTLMSHDMLTKEFVSSLMGCLSFGKRERLMVAIEKLESDPIFKDINLYQILSETPEDNMEATVTSLFKRLSSGHGIVLLTITKLVEKVEEKTLVLMDEPEGHLHPPLLSAFIRALSELLSFRNGVAIIATHSPVILQEVPKSCVWKLWRSGTEAKAARPDIETFGENVGVLTREIFGLEVTESGYHQMLSKAIAQCNSYEEVVAQFDGQLGNEAKAIIRGLLSLKKIDERAAS